MLGSEPAKRRSSPTSDSSVDAHLAELGPVVLVDVLAHDARRLDEVLRAASTWRYAKCSERTWAAPASPSRNASTRTYSVGSSRRRDQSNHRHPGSLRVASVNARVRFGPLVGVLGLHEELCGDEDHLRIVSNQTNAPSGGRCCWPAGGDWWLAGVHLTGRSSDGCRAQGLGGRRDREFPRRQSSVSPRSAAADRTDGALEHEFVPREGFEPSLCGF